MLQTISWLQMKIVNDVSIVFVHVKGLSLNRDYLDIFEDATLRQ
jgi:hypothetical protein